MGVLFALLAACCTAVANVMQRQAAALIPDEAELRPRLLGYLLRRPAWYAGMVALLGGFVFQASALNHDRLTVVQPLLIVELPVTLVLAGAVFHRPLDRPDWLAVAAISTGLVLVLLFADPSGGHEDSPLLDWLIAAGTVAGLMAALVLAGLRVGGGARAGLFGAASGIGFGLTAAFLKSATGLFDQGLHALVTSAEPYAMVVTGAASLFLAQNAFQAGALAVSQPAITISDPLASIALGVGLFGEQLQTGLALLPQAAGGTLIAGGVVALARSPLVAAGQGAAPASRDQPGSAPGAGAGRHAGGHDRPSRRGHRWRIGR
jgi:drug/metabolite transporter (DMT)-like permease